MARSLLSRLPGQSKEPRAVPVFKAPGLLFSTTDVVSTADPSIIVLSTSLGAPWAVRRSPEFGGLPPTANESLARIHLTEKSEVWL